MQMDKLVGVVMFLTKQNICRDMQLEILKYYPGTYYEKTYEDVLTIKSGISGFRVKTHFKHNPTNLDEVVDALVNITKSKLQPNCSIEMKGGNIWFIYHGSHYGVPKENVIQRLKEGYLGSYYFPFANLTGETHIDIKFKTKEV